MIEMTPRETVRELDKYIIGQADAKRAVAIALRDRWRRMQIDEPLRSEITPKNILLIGPTGVGKTEIARRLAKLSKAPFTKAEATKFTEVGYVGRDVEQMIRELADVAVKMLREEQLELAKPRAEKATEERLLDQLLPKPRPTTKTSTEEDTNKTTAQATDLPENVDKTREVFRQKLRAGELDDKEIAIDINAAIGVEIMGPPGMEEMTSQLQNIFKSMRNDKKKTRRLTVKEAYKILKEEEAAKLINEEQIRLDAITRVEQSGIVFIDEIDKITARHEKMGADVSREGVQRDLLPLIEGCTVNTKYGTVKTDHILFITSGAFHLSKPSDLVPELQGRLPIRVELHALSTEDFVRILTETNASLTKQYSALMETEGITLSFSKTGVQRIAEVAWQVNERTENIGARRLYTVMERLMESLSFEACDKKGQSFDIDEAYVNEHLGDLVEDEDLSRYIL